MSDTRPATTPVSGGEEDLRDVYNDYDVEIWRKLGMRTQEGKILVVGLDNSGKYTMTWRLRMIEETKNRPAPRRITEEVQIGKTILTTLRVGGLQWPKPWWMSDEYFEDVVGYVFVVDAADRESLDEAAGVLRTMTKTLPKVPFVVFGNKQDLPGAGTKEELLSALRWSRIAENVDAATVKVGSVLNREGYREAFDWLLDAMSEDGLGVVW